MAFYALVLFTKERDTPGLISTCWIGSESNWCWFPNVKSKELRNKLVKEHSSPKRDWLKCPIRVLKLFEGYEDADTCLNEAGNSSSLDSEVEETFIIIPHKRVIKREKESSDEADDSSSPAPPKKLTKVSPAKKTSRTGVALENSHLETPSLVANNEKDTPAKKTSCTRGVLENSHLETPNLVANNEKDTPAKKTSSTGSVLENLHLETPNLMPNNEEVTPAKKTSRTGGVLENQHLETPNLVPNNDIDIREELNSIKNTQSEIKNTQTEILSMLKDLMITVLKTECKLNSMTNQQVPIANSTNHPNVAEIHTILPLSSQEEVRIFDKRLKKNMSFRQQFQNLILSCHGRDCKAYVSSCLRKVLRDEAAAKYTLTGRNKTGVEKLCFQSTDIFLLIKEAAFKTYGNANGNCIRDSVSDWLLQAKFRMLRRLKKGSKDSTDS